MDYLFLPLLNDPAALNSAGLYVIHAFTGGAWTCIVLPVMPNGYCRGIKVGAAVYIYDYKHILAVIVDNVLTVLNTHMFRGISKQIGTDGRNLLIPYADNDRGLCTELLSIDPAELSSSTRTITVSDIVPNRAQYSVNSACWFTDRPQFIINKQGQHSVGVDGPKLQTTVVPYTSAGIVQVGSLLYYTGVDPSQYATATARAYHVVYDVATNTLLKSTIVPPGNAEHNLGVYQGEVYFFHGNGVVRYDVRTNKFRPTSYGAPPGSTCEPSGIVVLN